MSKGAERFRKLAAQRETDQQNSNKPEVINKIIGIDEPQLTSNSVAEQSDVTLTSNNEHEQSDVSVVSNTNTKHYSETLNSNTVTEQLNVTEVAATSTNTRIPHPIEEFERRLKRPTIEETHTRQTWLISNDLLRRLNKLARNQERGFKTHLVNYALERILNELEGK